TDPVNAPTTIQNVISNGSTVVPFGGLSNNTYYISMTPTGAACPTKTLGLVISTGPSEVDFAVAPLDITCFEDKGGVALTSIKGSLTVNYTYEIVDSNGNLVPAASVSPANPITQLQALGTVNLTGLDKGDYKIRLYQDQSVATGCTNPISSAFKSITIAGPSASLDTLFTVRKISLPDLATGSLLIGIKESQQEPYEIQLELKTPVISGQFYLLNPFGVPARNPQNLIMQYEAKNLFAGLYELKITDALGCQKVYPDIEIKVDTEIFIPNVFTPNGDQTNDTFYIRNLPPGSQVNITNRWGAEIYSSSNYENNWDGGTTADGIYFYRVTAGGTVFTGWLEIIRGQ
ncbi:MAG: gliding motility-associated C-terminal domain-containing protein, partial [Cyclobacteriaceae bacterium]